MSLPSLPALGGPLGDALAAATPAATEQLQQLAAPASDAAAKAADLQSQAIDADADAGAGAAEAATANASQDLGNAFSSVTPTGVPAVPCQCGDCIKAAVDPALPAVPAL